MKKWTAQSLMQCSSLYWQSCTLHAAVQLDIFSSLYDNPLSVKRLAKACQSNERGVHLLLTALCAMDLMRRKDDLCELTNFSRRYLCRQSNEYIGFIILHQGELVGRWADLRSTIRSGHPPLKNTDGMSVEERQNFILGMKNIAMAQAEMLVPHIDLSNREHLLDLGGGPGTYAIHFCKHNPELHATVFDLPSSRGFAVPYIEAEGLSMRIDFMAGDFFVDSLPHGSDVIWISQIIHSFGPSQVLELLRKAIKTARDGALIFIQEFMVSDDRNSGIFAALFGLNMLTSTQHGQSYSAKELSDMMESAGAMDVRLLELDLPQDCMVLCAVKPSK